MIQEIKDIKNLSIIVELKTFPNQGVLWEIIEKRQTGKIFALTDGVILIKENLSDPFVFVAGPLTEESVNDVVTLVGKLAFPMVYCNSRYHPLFLNKGWNFHLRTKLSLKNIQYAQEIKQSLDIKPIKTSDLFAKCTWYKDRSKLYGSVENFLNHGTGYALCIGSEVVSEAYASIGDGYAEIGVITHPNYRGKGYAAQITSHLVEQCVHASIIPQWSCNADNQASLKTGLKLGFEISDYYILLVPKAGNVLCPNLVDWIRSHPTSSCVAQDSYE